MKNYTAIYDTETMSNIGYSFKAENLESAKEFCNWKFSVPVKRIVEHNESNGEDVVVFEMINEHSELLSVQNAEKLIGKKIKWHAPADSANNNYTGVAIITKVEKNERRPLMTTTLEGDDLSYSFNEWNIGGGLTEPLCYLDGDRYVTFSIV